MGGDPDRDRRPRGRRAERSRPYLGLLWTFPRTDRELGVELAEELLVIAFDGAPILKSWQHSAGTGRPESAAPKSTSLDGGLYLGMMPGSLKAVDLRRDPRLALHSPTEDTPQSNPTSWLGDAKIAGVALETADGSNLFRIGMTEVVLITVEGDHLAIRSWHPDRGVEVKER